MKNIIDAFINEKKIAVVGVSRDKQKWGHMLFTELMKKGYTVYPVNPNAEEIEGVSVYAAVADLPKDVENAIISLPAETAEQILEGIGKSGIKRVWLHQGGGEGASSSRNIEVAKSKGLETVHNFCPLMFFPPVGIHGVHRFFKKLFGGYPKEYTEA